MKNQPIHVTTKQTIINLIQSIQTDRVSQKNQILADIKHFSCGGYDQIIYSIECFIKTHSRSCFSFFGNSRLRKGLVRVLEEIKRTIQQEEKNKIEKENYQQYVQHDNLVDKIIKKVLDCNASCKDMDTLKRIVADFGFILDHVENSLSSDPSEIKTTRLKKLNEFLNPVNEYDEDQKIAFLKLFKLRAQQFINVGLLNLNNTDPHCFYGEKIFEDKIRFSHSLFEFQAKREALLTELFDTQCSQDNGRSYGAEENSQLNAIRFIIKLIEDGHESSDDFDWLKGKIMLLTNTTAAMEDLMRAAQSENPSISANSR